MVAHTFDSSTGEEEAGGSLEFKAGLLYTDEPCLLSEMGVGEDKC